MDEKSKTEVAVIKREFFRDSLRITPFKKSIDGKKILSQLILYGILGLTMGGAASQMVKAVAAKRNAELRSSDLNRFIAKLRREANEPGVRRLWQIATSLHQNFYEAWHPGETVKESIEEIKRFPKMLARILQLQS